MLNTIWVGAAIVIIIVLFLVIKRKKPTNLTDESASVMPVPSEPVLDSATVTPENQTDGFQNVLQMYEDDDDHRSWTQLEPFDYKTAYQEDGFQDYDVAYIRAAGPVDTKGVPGSWDNALLKLGLEKSKIKSRLLFHLAADNIFKGNGEDAFVESVQAFFATDRVPHGPGPHVYLFFYLYYLYENVPSIYPAEPSIPQLMAMNSPGIEISAKENDAIRELAQKTQTQVPQARLSDAEKVLRIRLKKKPQEYDFPASYKTSTNKTSTSAVKEKNETKLAKDSDADSPADKDLLNACRIGDLSLVKEIIEQRGGNVNAVQNDATPLIITTHLNYPEISKYLIQNGAEVNVKDARDNTPLIYALQKISENVPELLINKGADVNAIGSNEETPLYLAAKSGSLEYVKLLLSKGAKINQGDPALIEALKGDYIDIIQTLINNGADLNLRDSYFNKSALHWAIGSLWQKTNEKIAKMLIAAGADVNIQDNEGNTPLSLAVQKNLDDLVELLKSKGAKEAP